MQSKRKCSAIFLLFLFATIGSSNSKTNSRKNLNRKIQKVVSGSEGLLSSNQKQRRRQLQTNETVAPAKEYDTTKLDKDGNPTVNDGSSSTAKEQKEIDESSSEGQQLQTNENVAHVKEPEHDTTKLDNENVAPVKEQEHDTTKLHKDGLTYGSSSTAKEQKESDGSSLSKINYYDYYESSSEGQQTRQQDISVLREHPKKKTNFATPHGHNQQVLEMYKLRGGGDAVAGILKTVETENRILTGNDDDVVGIEGSDDDDDVVT